LPVNIEVNPTNPNGLDAEFVLSAIGMAAEEWDDGEYSGWGGVTDELFSNEITITYEKDYDDLAWSKPGGSNTIVFGNYPTANVIAVTIIWYSRATRTIIEFDMALDTDFTWGNADNDPKVMDLQNIVTHELGHGIGLNDLYLTAAYRETMYGYAGEGETIKRSLHVGDQAGITKLYG